MSLILIILLYNSKTKLLNEKNKLEEKVFLLSLYDRTDLCAFIQISPLHHLLFPIFGSVRSSRSPKVRARVRSQFIGRALNLNLSDSNSLVGGLSELTS